MSFYRYQSAIGGEKKEILVFTNMVCYQHRGLYTFLVCGGDFFQYRLNVKIHVQIHFTVASTILLSCTYAEIEYGFLRDGGKNE